MISSCSYQQHAWYRYDGDGNMVWGGVNSVTTYYPGRHYNKEVVTVDNRENFKIQKFYFAANADGSWNSTIQYTAFGEVRASKGVTATKYRYTGQLAQDVLELIY